jgi:hypothetical protein
MDVHEFSSRSLDDGGVEPHNWVVFNGLLALYELFKRLFAAIDHVTQLLFIKRSTLPFLLKHNNYSPKMTSFHLSPHKTMASLNSSSLRKNQIVIILMATRKKFQLDL